MVERQHQTMRILLSVAWWGSTLDDSATMLGSSEDAMCPEPSVSRTLQSGPQLTEHV